MAGVSHAKGLPGLPGTQGGFQQAETEGAGGDQRTPTHRRARSRAGSVGIGFGSEGSAATGSTDAGN